MIKLTNNTKSPIWHEASKLSTTHSVKPHVVSAVANVLSIDVEDWFHGMRFDPADWPNYESRLHVGMDVLLELLDKHDVKATFFVLAPLAEQFPQMMRRLVKQGHEIGTHGMSHRPIFEQTPVEFRRELRQSIEILQDVTGEPIYGHRAPFFSITEQSLWALDVLADCGIRYDSSIFPVHNSRYGIPDAPRNPYQHGNGIYELPIATLGIGPHNLPIGGGFYGRFFPAWLLERGVRQLNAAGHPAMLYLHPWELDPDHPMIAGNVSRLYRFTHYYRLDKMAAQLDRLLSSFQFATACQVVQSSLQQRTVASV